VLLTAVIAVMDLGKHLTYRSKKRRKNLNKENTMAIYSLTTEALHKYRGGGKVWAAIYDKKVIDFIYMGHYAPNWVKKSNGQCIGKNNSELFEKYRAESRAKLAKLGQLKTGTLKGGELLTAD
jgi:hypothetical protein